MMAVVLTRGKSLISWLIKVQTRSEYSHASLWFSDKTLIEATWPKVKKTANYHPGTRDDVFMLDLSEEQEAAVRAFAEEQVGKPYDLTMVVRFVTRQQETRNPVGTLRDELMDSLVHQTMPALVVPSIRPLGRRPFR